MAIPGAAAPPAGCWRCVAPLSGMPAREDRYRSRVYSKHRSLQAVCFRGWRLVRSETRSQTRRHRCSRQGCAPAASHGGHRDVAEWRALGSGRPRPPSPEHRHDRLLRQGGCRAAQTDRSAVAGGEEMMAAVESYLAVRRAAGFTLSNTEYLLRSFAEFAADQKQTHIRTATAIDWASQAGSVAQRHARYQTVCRFAQYFRVEDSRHELPPANHFGYRKTLRIPRIYSPVEIAGLVFAATRLPSSDSLLPKTYAALISLLAATGLRISEALHLLVSDITPNRLLLRRTKFQKTRLVPLHETAVTGLAHYLMHRQEARCGGDRVFVTDEGQPLVYWKVHSVFRTLLKSAGIKPSGGRWPRIHELRHTFAVRALESSPTGRQRIGQHMLALATYLGHVNINATYWYLETTPELLLDIAVIAENFVQGGRPCLPSPRTWKHSSASILSA